MHLMPRITSEDNLYAAWRAVRGNRGGPGMDAVCLGEYEVDLAANLNSLRCRLQEETYIPLPLRYATMPKRGGGVRELAIPAIADRVAQRAFAQVLETIFEPLFLPCSFGYRPGRGVQDAVEAVLRYRTAGMGWILDADVRDFFSSVDHALLRERLGRHIGDRAVLRIIGLWLEAGALADSDAPRPSLLTLAAARTRAALQAVLNEEEADCLNNGFDAPRRTFSALTTQFGMQAARLAWDNRQKWLPLLAAKSMLTGGGAGIALLGAVAVGQHILINSRPRAAGTPQGGPISPLLSNVYLHSFDEAMTQAGLRLVRYADDFVVCCASEARARQAQEIAATELARLRLTLHPEKTRIGACSDPLLFLGHEFDGDGAFPVCEEAPSPVMQAVRRGVDSAKPAVRKAATTAGQAAQRATQAAQSGAHTIRRAGASAVRDIAGRWCEVKVGKE